MKFAQGDKVWVLPGPVTYPGNVTEVISETYAGTVLGGDAQLGNNWYQVDIPDCPLPPEANRWVIHTDFLRPRQDEPPKAQGMSSWSHSFWCMVAWNPLKVTA